MKSSAPAAKEKKVPKKGISKGHMTFTSAEAGYFNEMIGKEQQTRWNFSLDSSYYTKPRDPTLGQRTPRQGDLLEYYLPPEGHKDVGPLPQEPDPKEMWRIMEERKRIEALKVRREEVKAKLNHISTKVLGNGVTRHIRDVAMMDMEHIEPPPRRLNPTRYTLVMMSEGFKSSATPECIDRIMLKRGNK